MNGEPPGSSRVFFSVEQKNGLTTQVLEIL